MRKIFLIIGILIFIWIAKANAFTQGWQDNTGWVKNGTQITQQITSDTVGVGTTNPTQTLEVLGTFSVRGFQTSTWTVKTATNQACNTTCATSMCAYGVDNTNKLPLACTDGTADTCVCMGP